MAKNQMPEEDMDFPIWAATMSQSSNRSLAGARLVPPLDALHGRELSERVISQAGQWGMIIADADGTEHPDVTHAKANQGVSAESGCPGPARPCDEEGRGVTDPDPDGSLHPGTKPAGSPQATTASDFDMTFGSVETMNYMRRVSGAEAIAWAQSRMPVLRGLLEELRTEVDFGSARIAACLILEPKTAVLLRELKRAGAQVGVYCEPGAVDQRVAEQLKREGITVCADSSWDDDEARQGALDLMDRIQPNLIIDDGASFARLALRDRPELAANLMGVAEETTSGVRAFAAMEEDAALTFPVIAVNDSRMKTDFDNAHGTGETCLTTMQDLLGAQCFQDQRVLVIGYGPVGRGFALGARALGARVSVSDIDPRAALRAVFDGFPALDTPQALPRADMVISATGVVHTVDLDDMRAMRPGAVLAVIGGIANEIALDRLPGRDLSQEDQVSTIEVPNGPELTLLSHGDGVNYTAGGGNPIEIMDLSFAVQVSALAHLLRQGRNLAHRVHRLPDQVDRRIASLALKVRGHQARRQACPSAQDWRTTRFDARRGSREA